MTILKKANMAASVLVLSMLAVPSVSAQDDFTIKLGGRLHVDYASASSDNTDFDVDATALRRARLKGHGQFGKNLKYKIETTFDESGDVNLEDAYLSWKPNGSPISFKAGHFKTQNSLQEANSSLDEDLIERAAFTDAFELDRRVGFEISTKSDNYQVQLGIFGENLEEIENNDGNEGFAVAGRAVYKFDVSGGLIHTGASFRHRDQNDADDLRYRQRPFVEQTGRIISTGRVAESDTFFGGELAALFGQAWAIGEYTVVNADCAEDSTVCTEDPSFNGWSIGGGYVFGGKRNYSVGKFKRVTVDNPVTEGGWGAVSINARYDSLDLTDEGIEGGDLDTFAVGVNWWLHKQTRLQFNYFNSDATLSGPNVGPSLGLQDEFAAAVADATLTDDTVDGFVARLQFDF
ncbi:MAG: porin [Maricaulaceae bacterium]